MQITHYCNSFIEIKSKNSSIACDPWVGKTRDNGWYSYPIKNVQSIKSDVFNSEFVYISHLHCDHLDFKTLKNFKNKNVKFIIKKFSNKILKKRLEAFGFKKILEIDEFKKTKINKDFTIAIIPQIITNSGNLSDKIQFDLDTSIVIQSNHDKKIFYNNVDNSINEDVAKKINSFVRKNFKKNIDIFTCSLGAASEYPQAFLNINRAKEYKKIINQSLLNTKLYLKIFKAKFFFPSGGAYAIYGKFFQLNKYIAQPGFDKIKSYFNKMKTEVFNIEGGGKIFIKKNIFKIKESKVNENIEYKKKFITSISNNKYYYEKKILTDIKKLDYLFVSAKKNYFNFLLRKKISNAWKINFIVYKNLQINNSCNIDKAKSKILKEYRIVNNQLNYKKNSPQLSCYLDYSLFIQLLVGNFPWNTSLSGSVIMFKRKPNKFYPNMVFSLNYLRN